MQRLLEAFAFAARLHAGARQKGHGERPYINHVIDVALRVSASEAADETLLIAAVLHDTVEKSRATPDQIAGLFGPDVARLVAEVTHPAEGDSPSPAACRLRLADKAANLASLTSSSPAEFDRTALAGYLAAALPVAEACRAADAGLARAFDAAAEAARAALAQAESSPGRG